WHVESAAIDQALANVVAAQGALPMARVWGMGTTASADGQFYPAARQGEAMNTVNARYGNDPGIKAYTHVNDRFAPFASRTIPATVSEAPYLLDGLTMNEAGRRIEEQYADTGGFTVMWTAWRRGRLPVLPSRSCHFREGGGPCLWSSIAARAALWSSLSP
uniref:Tn3 family transposase n=1 Tax=Pseudomonas proteolytica TaxID=219574 RepID=UPI0030D91690